VTIPLASRRGGRPLRVYAATLLLDVLLCAIKAGAMLKHLIVLLLCFVLPFSATLASQQASASKSGASSKAAQKDTEAYSRTSAAKTQFMRETGYRNGRPGYVVAYRKSLACGGTDNIDNMEWLTVAEAKSKDKAARKGCK
jgi:hypothetical protein